MKILYIHQYFKTPKQAGGTRSYWICRALIDAGHQVVMVTARDNKTNATEEEVVDGINVYYVNNIYNNRLSIAQRMKSFFQFMIKSYVVARKEVGVDLVYATSTPLSVGITALFLKWFNGKDFVFEVRDLWPDVPISMGAINNKFLQKMVYYLEKTIYDGAAQIVALSIGMREHIISKGIDSKKIRVIPNMSKNKAFYSRDIEPVTYEEFDLEKDKFYAIHFGAMGRVNGLDYIIDSAKLLKDNKDIVFLLVGDGSERERLQNLCVEYDLSNVKFLGPYSMQKVSRLVNLSACSVVSVADLKIFETNSANKYFDTLAAQKPVIVNFKGWIKDEVECARCGAYVNVKKPQELADLLADWSESPQKINDMGLNSRKLAEDKYDKELLTSQVVNIIENV